MKKLIYTFFNYYRNTSRLLYKSELNGWDKYFIPSTFATNKLLDMVGQYDVVLGIADNRKNAKRNRIDENYKNLYGRNKILKDGQDLYKSNSHLDLGNLEGYYISEKASNGSCNRSAYLIMNRIIINSLRTKFVFCHLVKDYSHEDLISLLKKVQ